MNSKLIPTEYNNQRILTTQQLADNYETDTRRISENFSRNEERYTAGKHYYLLEGDELKAFKREYANCGIAENINKLYLWTEKGALLHAKSLNTDIAWQVYDSLVENYFKPTQSIDTTQLSPQMQLLMQMATTMAQQELKVNQLEAQTADVKRQLDVVQDTIIQRDDDWRKSIITLINKAVETTEAKDHKAFRQMTYDILDERAHCRVNDRLRNLRERLYQAGATKTKLKEATRLDVIENDPKLKEIYTMIIKELSIKHLNQKQAVAQ